MKDEFNTKVPNVHEKLALEIGGKSKTAVGLIQQQAASKKGVTGLLPITRVPTRQSDSIDMMCILLEEIFSVKAGIYVTAFYRQKKKGSISIQFETTDGDFEKNSHANYDPKTVYHVVRASLLKMSKIPYKGAEGLTFHPEILTIKAEDKLCLFNFINGILLNSPDLCTPSHIQINPLEPEVYKQALDDLATLGVMANADSAVSDRLFQAIPNKPFIGMKHYLSYLYLASQANLSIPLDHIYRCIQQEGHERPGLYDNGFIFGGFH